MIVDINELVGKTIEFLPAIDDFESYAEGKMRAVVTDIVPMYTDDPDPREHVYKLFVNYAKYDEYNKQFESANYYDKSGVDCLSARQAGYYSVADCIYMPNPNVDSWDLYLKVID